MKQREVEYGLLKLVICALCAAFIVFMIVFCNWEVKAEASDHIFPDFTEEMSAMPCNMVEAPTEESKQFVSLGVFRLTAYCSCHKCCGKWAENRPLDSNGKEIVYGASGNRLYSYYSIAVDPSVIPYGSIVLINGYEYEAMDTGVTGNCIDVYFDSHEEACQFGEQYKEVFLKQ